MTACAKVKKKLNVIGRMGMSNLIQIGQGFAGVLSLTLTEDDGGPFSLADIQVDFMVKRSLDDPDANAVIHKSTDTGQASVTIQDSLSEDTMQVLFYVGGPLGNDYTVDIESSSAYSKNLNNIYSSLLFNGVDLQNGDQVATLVTVDGLSEGDILLIDDTINSVTVTVLTIDRTINRISFDPVTLPVDIIDGATVTRADSTLRNGSTSLILDSITNVYIGDVINVDDGTTNIDLLITDISGNAIYFDEVSGLALPIVDGADVAEISFNLVLKDINALEVERHDFVSIQPTNTVKYVVSVVSGTVGTLLEVKNLGSTSAPPDNIPVPVANQALTGGQLPANGIKVTNTANGLAEITLDLSDTQNLKPRDYYYDIKFRSISSPSIIDWAIRAAIFRVADVVYRS